MIFIDTSALYALADRADARHRESLELFDAILSEGEILLTHNYVLLEAMALLQHRLGTSASLKLAKSAANFDVVWVDRATHENAVRRLEQVGKRRVSLVDHVSFLVMRERGVERALAFDPDFEAEGFRLVSR